MDFEAAAHGIHDIFHHHKHKPCHWEPIKNINDPYVQEMGRFAVMEHVHHLCGVGLKFVGVVSGEIMAEGEGKKYRLVIEVKEEIVTPCAPSSIKFYAAVVLDKQCDRSWKLESFDPLLWQWPSNPQCLMR